VPMHRFYAAYGEQRRTMGPSVPRLIPKRLKSYSGKGHLTRATTA
jgi:hypothetical protein